MKIRAVIPCAGLGTRMGMKRNESKELLIDPSTNKPIIQWCLDLCKEHDLTPLIITRKEKTDLLDFCKANNLDCLVIEPKGEWPRSVVASNPQWYENNILILPDTRFGDTSIIKQMKDTLNMGVYSVFAMHKVDNLSKWGAVKNYILYEKPDLKEPGYAWGLIGFKSHEGYKLFKLLSEDNATFLFNSSFLFLEWFKDITRTGKIE